MSLNTPGSNRSNHALSVSPPSRSRLSPGTRAVRPSSPVLLTPLPPSLALEKESRAQSELELAKQKAQIRRERELAEALQDAQFRVERAKAKDKIGSWGGLRKSPEDKAKEQEKKTAPFSRPPQAYELYAAIDKHDLDYISRVRDHAFSLLLQKNAGEFPIVYAARIGDSHRDVVIMLVGAFSRYVNNLEEDEFKERKTQDTLKMLRANLKLAIDNALLPASSSHLLSSYLQVLIMSEGDSWIHKTAHDVGLLLRDNGTKPVAEAEALVRRFATRELRSVPHGVAEVEEYVANATLDLIIMAAWGVASSQLGVDPLPTYTFARDLRTFGELRQAMDAESEQLRKVNRRTRFVLEQLLAIAGDTRKGLRARVAELRDAIDGR